jgi:hypothetical protein
MIALVDRLDLTDDLRYNWLQTNDTYLICELKNLFENCLFIRGEKKTGKGSEKAAQYFKQFPKVDYLIYLDDAPTKCGLVYVEESRIMFYRPGKEWSRPRWHPGNRWFRAAACRFVRLKQQILTIFDEEIIKEE